MCIKTLIVTRQFYDEQHKIGKASEGNTVIVSNLCRSMQSEIDLDIFAYSQLSKELELGYARLLSNQYFGFIRGLFNKNIISTLLRGEGLYGIYATLIAENCKRYIRKNSYDIVNIHDLSRTNLKILQWCSDNHKRCVLTLHIYIGKKPSQFSVYEDMHAREIVAFTQTNVPIIVVSSGMKKRIIADFPNINQKRIIVIPNGTAIKEKSHLLKKLPNGKVKTLLCIGSITERKNQIQIIHALAKMNIEQLKKIRVIFIGADRLNGLLQREIERCGIEGVAEYVGEVEHSKISLYYEKANAVISASINEAFGLTFIEGYCHGLPAVFPRNIDAFDELYSTDVAVAIDNLNDSSIIEAICRVCKTNWNKDLIMKYAKKFDIRTVAKNYVDTYYRIFREE